MGPADVLSSGMKKSILDLTRFQINRFAILSSRCEDILQAPYRIDTSEIPHAPYFFDNKVEHTHLIEDKNKLKVARRVGTGWVVISMAIAIFIGIIVTTIIGIPMGVTLIPDSLTMSGISNISLTAFQLDLPGVFSKGIPLLLVSVVSFFIVDMFDTVGTLLGTAGNAGMLDEDGNLPGGDRALIADALGTIFGSIMGTSTVTTFVESSTGIQEGARTGLSALVTAALFLLATLLAPVAGIVPGAATAPALIIVGVYMIAGATKVNWNDFEEALPCFLTIVMMPFAYSISDGIGFGFISYTLIKVARGKAKEVPVLIYLLSLMFIIMYIAPNFVK